MKKLIIILLALSVLSACRKGTRNRKYTEYLVTTEGSSTKFKVRYRDKNEVWRDTLCERYFYYEFDRSAFQKTGFDVEQLEPFSHRLLASIKRGREYEAYIDTVSQGEKYQLREGGINTLE